jgi:hypothetical protein
MLPPVPTGARHEMFVNRPGSDVVTRLRVAGRLVTEVIELLATQV